jgi:hypothetical protein
LSSEQTLNQKKSTRRRTRKKDNATNSNKENKDYNETKTNKEIEGQTQNRKLPPRIYDPTINQKNNLLTEDNNSNSLTIHKEQINNQVKEITNYYLEFHKNMINTYNSIYLQILQNTSDLSSDVFFTNTERFVNYQSEMREMYMKFITNRDESLNLVDNIITKNIDTFIKSIELTQKFYKDIIQSYFNCIRKS